MKTKESKKKGRKNAGGGVVVDSRFAKVHSDPRFATTPKAHRQVQIDSRFAGVFSDPSFQLSGAVDKWGRKVKRSKKNEEMERYYRLDNGQTDDHSPDLLSTNPDKPDTKPDSETAEPPHKKHQPLHQSDASQDDANPIAENKVDKSIEMETWGAEHMARMRGLIGSSSESELDSADEPLTDEEQGMDENELDLSEWGVGAYAANPDEQVDECEPTKRLAVVDLDWEKVSAVDIFVMVRSFIPNGGSMHRVMVYLSDYGLERMEKEAVAGPSALGVFDSLTGKKGAKNDSKKGRKSRKGRGVQKRLVEEDDDSDYDDEINVEKLRLYEKSKLRYYYAVVELDSVETARHLVSELDGREFEMSQCKFDLRYIPDEEDFGSRQVRDSATEVPADYAAPVFECNALQKTNLKMSWDDEDDKRKKVVRRNFTEDDLLNQDFDAYMASESDDDDDDDNMGEDPIAIRERYRKLFGLGNGGEKGGKSSDSNSNSGSDSESDSGLSERKERGSDLESDSGSGSDNEENGFNRLFTDAEQGKSQSKHGRELWKKYQDRRRDRMERKKRMGQKRVFSSSDSDIGMYSHDEGGAGSGEEGAMQADLDPFFETGEIDREMVFEISDDKEEGKKNSEGGENAVRRVSKEERRAQREEAKRKQAELELLLLDEKKLRDGDDVGNGVVDALGGVKGKRKQKMSRKERIRNAKARREAKKRGSDEDDVDQEDFKVNLSDPRFSGILTSADYALDPTDPAFKRSKGVEDVMKQVTELRVKNKGLKGKGQKKQSMGQQAITEESSKDDPDAGFQRMIENLKQKSAKVSAQNGLGVDKKKRKRRNKKER